VVNLQAIRAPVRKGAVLSDDEGLLAQFDLLDDAGRPGRLGLDDVTGRWPARGG